MDRLDIVGSGTVPYDGYSEGDWNTPRQMVQRVRDSIAAAELEANTKIREIYVGVPGEYVHVLGVRGARWICAGRRGYGRNRRQRRAGRRRRTRCNVSSESGCRVLHRSPAWFIRGRRQDRRCRPRAAASTLRALVTFVVAEQNVHRGRARDAGRAERHDSRLPVRRRWARRMLLLPLEDRDRGGAADRLRLSEHRNQRRSRATRWSITRCCPRAAGTSPPIWPRSCSIPHARGGADQARLRVQPRRVRPGFVRGGLRRGGQPA